MSKPQIPKPEYLADQIKAHASQRARADIDNVPFVLSDIAYDKNQNPIVGPIGPDSATSNWYRVSCGGSIPGRSNTTRFSYWR